MFPIIIISIPMSVLHDRVLKQSSPLQLYGEVEKIDVWKSCDCGLKFMPTSWWRMSCPSQINVVHCQYDYHYLFCYCYYIFKTIFFYYCYHCYYYVIKLKIHLNLECKLVSTGCVYSILRLSQAMIQLLTLRKGCISGLVQEEIKTHKWLQRTLFNQD